MFVAGCHRSGTSYVSSLLSAVVGWQRSSDLDRTVDNPRGYFESTLLGPLNQALLAKAGFSWDKPPLSPIYWMQGHYLELAIENKRDFEMYALQDSWVDKDPRLSLTMPFFAHLLLKRVGCVVPIRHPLAVAQSLLLRDGFSQEKGCLIWYLYNRNCAHFYDDAFDLLLSYEQLLAGSRQQLDRIHAWLKARLPRLASAELYETLLISHRECSREDLCRNRFEAETSQDLRPLPDDVVTFCSELYSKLVASQFDPDCFRQAFLVVPDFIVDRYDQIFAEGMPSLEYRRSNAISVPLDKGIGADLQTGQYGRDQDIIRNFADLIETVNRLRQDVVDGVSSGHAPVPGLSDHSPSDELSALTSELDRLRQQLSAHQSSKFWRLTQPMRHFADWLKNCLSN